jgi:hypothetical protein
MTTVKFDTSRFETRIIDEIAQRAMGLSARTGDPFTKLDISMDITAVHCNGCPLRLEALRDADDFNFAHDILGIRRHLDRETGRLGDYFIPRFAERPIAKAEQP